MLKALLNFLTGGSREAEKPKRAAAGTGSLHDLEGFVDYVVRSLVDYPDEVRIQSEENEEGCSIRISCRGVAVSSRIALQLNRQSSGE